MAAKQNNEQKDPTSKPDEVRDETPQQLAERIRSDIRRKADKSPLDVLFPYQREIVTDPSRFKLLNCARQCGKSTVFAFEAAMHCVLKKNDRWIALSRGERQVKEWVAKALDWSEQWCSYYFAVTGKKIEIYSSLTEIAFSNGSKITGIPANPATARGYSANVILDEFAYHEHANEIWAAVFPAITNELNGKFMLRVGSTVAGRSNKFWEIYSQKKSPFKKWKVTIDDAIKDGLPIDKAELKAAIADDDIWSQEYLCMPVEGTLTLLSLEQIRKAKSRTAQTDLDKYARVYGCSGFELLDKVGRQFFVGVDIGRKHDLTVIWIVEYLGKTATTCAIVEMLHRDFSEQEETIEAYIKGRAVKRVCVDATGIGAHLSENLAKKFPSKIEQCVFSMQFKNDLYTSLQKHFQEGSVRIPHDGEGRQVIEEDLHSLQRVFTSSGNLLFYAPSNADGHADRAASLALALRAVRNETAHSLGSFVATPKWQQQEKEAATYFQLENGATIPHIAPPRYINI